MTILDACVEILKDAKGPMTADEIHASIRDRKLFEFKAKDPKGMVRAAIRKHLQQPPPHRLHGVEGARFTLS